MPQTPRRTPIRVAAAAKRPGQDIVAAKQAAQFPSVGMTLRSYKYDPRDRSRRAPGQQVVLKRGRFKRFRERFTLKRTVIVLAILVLLVGGFVGGKFLYNAHKLFGGNIFNILSTAKLKGESDGRVNILLAGNSADDVGHSGAELTDSIMLISIDTRKNKAFLLSIPRDLWVQIPGDGHQKINGVYVTGESTGFNNVNYPPGGMGQLEQVVSRSLDLPIHYYALVDYQALKQAVDAVGGVDFTVKSEDPRGIYDPNIDWTSKTRAPLVKLSNGTHHLDGQQALNLARARGDAYNSYGLAGSDFDRAENQRKLLVALKSKAVSAGTLSNPAKLSSLFDAFGNNVKTDFKLDEVRRLYDLMKKVDGSSIQSLSLNEVDGKSLLKSYASPSGQSALIPAAGVDDFSDIQSFLRRKTSSNPVVQEDAKVVVLNGTLANGLAAKAKSQLRSKQIFVETVGDAFTTTQAKTSIIKVSGANKPASGTVLKQIFGNNVTTQNPYAGVYDEVDFIIVLGRDRVTTAGSSNSTSSGQ